MYLRMHGHRDTDWRIVLCFAQNWIWCGGRGFMFLIELVDI